jgi:hypothetical protein
MISLKVYKTQMYVKSFLIAAYLGFAAASLNVTSGPSADGGKL